MLEQVKAEFPHARFVEQTAKHVCFVHLRNWSSAMTVYSPSEEHPSWRCDIYDSSVCLQGESQESLGAAHVELLDAARTHFVENTAKRLEALACLNK